VPPLISRLTKPRHHFHLTDRIPPSIYSTAPRRASTYVSLHQTASTSFAFRVTKSPPLSFDRTNPHRHYWHVSLSRATVAFPPVTSNRHRLCLTSPPKRVVTFPLTPKPRRNCRLLFLNRVTTFVFVAHQIAPSLASQNRVGNFLSPHQAVSQISSHFLKSHQTAPTFMSHPPPPVEFASSLSSVNIIRPKFLGLSCRLADSNV
jgi:hypothetical protein